MSSFISVHTHILFLKQTIKNSAKKITKADATVLQQVAEVVKHRTLVLTTDAAEIAEKTAAVCHHSRESDLLLAEKHITKFSNT